MEKIALFPGSFDPFTKGHLDIVNRSLKLFHKVIIAMGHNSKKHRYFNILKTKKSIENYFKSNPRVEVLVYDGLTAKIANKENAQYLIRGLRNTTDFEYENSLSQINKHLNLDLDTVFLIASTQFAHINSSIIKEVHKYGGDISAFIPFKQS
ncbi:MAG: pantetheine-phosphate adenylyltransferase [Flammeovirgaceae bacterium]|nr:pantetheine-phosphate adenylyltransferase [Flammeovirgaceae bacterium]